MCYVLNFCQIVNELSHKKSIGIMQELFIIVQFCAPGEFIYSPCSVLNGRLPKLEDVVLCNSLCFGYYLIYSHRLRTTHGVYCIFGA